VQQQQQLPQQLCLGSTPDGAEEQAAAQQSGAASAGVQDMDAVLNTLLCEVQQLSAMRQALKSEFEALGHGAAVAGLQTLSSHLHAFPQVQQQKQSQHLPLRPLQEQQLPLQPASVPQLAQCPAAGHLQQQDVSKGLHGEPPSQAAIQAQIRHVLHCSRRSKHMQQQECPVPTPEVPLSEPGTPQKSRLEAPTGVGAGTATAAGQAALSIVAKTATAASGQGLLKDDAGQQTAVAPSSAVAEDSLGMQHPLTLGLAMQQQRQQQEQHPEPLLPPQQQPRLLPNEQQQLQHPEPPQQGDIFSLQLKPFAGRPPTHSITLVSVDNPLFGSFSQEPSYEVQAPEPQPVFSSSLAAPTDLISQQSPHPDQQDSTNGVTLASACQPLQHGSEAVVIPWQSGMETVPVKGLNRAVLDQPGEEQGVGVSGHGRGAPDFVPIEATQGTAAYARGAAECTTSSYAEVATAGLSTTMQTATAAEDCVTAGCRAAAARAACVQGAPSSICSTLIIPTESSELDVLERLSACYSNQSTAAEAGSPPCARPSGGGGTFEVPSMHQSAATGGKGAVTTAGTTIFSGTLVHANSSSTSTSGSAGSTAGGCSVISGSLATQRPASPGRVVVSRWVSNSPIARRPPSPTVALAETAAATTVYAVPVGGEGGQGGGPSCGEGLAVPAVEGAASSAILPQQVPPAVAGAAGGAGCLPAGTVIGIPVVLGPGSNASSLVAAGAAAVGAGFVSGATTGEAVVGYNRSSDQMVQQSKLHATPDAAGSNNHCAHWGVGQAVSKQQHEVQHQQGKDHHKQQEIQHHQREQSTPTVVYTSYAPERLPHPGAWGHSKRQHRAAAPEDSGGHRGADATSDHLHPGGFLHRLECQVVPSGRTAPCTATQRCHQPPSPAQSTSGSPRSAAGRRVKVAHAKNAFSKGDK
jgi:hypothetical protein